MKIIPIQNRPKYLTPSGLEYAVIAELNDKDCLIQFTQSGNIQKTTFISASKRGKIKDFSVELINGVGYAKGTIDEPVIIDDCFCKWKSILHRCTAQNRPEIYKDVEISKDWHDYRNFKSWYIAEMQSIRIDKIPKGVNLCIDKDLFGSLDRRLYSENTCCIIPRGLNASLGKFDKSEISYQTGNTIRRFIEDYKGILSDRVINKLEEILPNAKPAKDTLRFTAKIWYDGKIYKAKSIAELKQIIKNIEEG